MYHPDIVAATVSRMESRLGHDLIPYSVPEVKNWLSRIATATDPLTGKKLRDYTPEESAFMRNEIHLCTASFHYWAERYCNTPDAPIWMGDLSFAPLGGVKVGDEVIGWAKRPVRGTRKHPERPSPKRKFTTYEYLVRSKVLAVSRRCTEVVRVQMASGNTIRCTPEHLWSEGIAQHRQYRPWVQATPGAVLRHVVTPTAAPWSILALSERELGWLGGIYDGEGSWLSISQCPKHNPEVYAEIARILSTAGVDFTAHAEGRIGFNITGGRQSYLRFLLATRPVKSANIEKRILGSVHGTPDVVVSVEPDGESEVISLQTETGNYVAWGYASKNCFINKAGAVLEPMFPLWESQNLILAEIGRLEKATYDSLRSDGILINLLKARQLGGSTLSQSILAHRTTTQNNLFGLVAADVPDQSAFLFDMYERVVENLPFFLQPNILEHVKNTEIKFDGGSNVWVGSGKSKRGVVGERGQLGRGKTLSVVHLSELSTWEDTHQLRAALIPTIPETIRSIAIFESSGRGRNNWWHKHWEASKAGHGRFTPVFIPWYSEVSKYSRIAPVDWTPSPTTIAHAKRCELSGPKWVHHTVSLTREQLYWYESTRAAHEADNDLGTFLENYCLTGDTKVGTVERGIIPLSHLQPGEHLCAGPISAVFDVGEKPVVEICTAWGRSIHCTPDHKLCVGDLVDFRWVAAEQLVPGDQLLLGSPLLARTQAKVSWSPLPGYSSHLVVDETWARFLGYFMSDGCFYNNAVIVACASRDQDVCNEVATLLHALSGSPSKLRQVSKGCLEIRSNSVRWREVLGALGALRYRESSRSHVRKVCVPPAIWASPAPQIADFLSALFEGDGHAYTNTPRASVSSRHHGFIRDVQLLLLALGINGKIRMCHTRAKRDSTKKYVSWSLEIFGEAVNLFHDKVGFRSVRKRAGRRCDPARAGRRATPHTFVDTVESVSPTGVARVYDATVDSSAHAYLANGILVHNCADDEEAFQHSGKSIFSAKVLQRIVDQARDPIGVLEVGPNVFVQKEPHV